MPSWDTAPPQITLSAGRNPLSIGLPTLGTTPLPVEDKVPKGSVVRHSKIGPPMTLWVIRVGWTRLRPARHVRFAPFAMAVLARGERAFL